MKPNPMQITLHNNVPRIKKMLLELILRPRRDLVKWAKITEQTPNIKIGYPGQHLASLVTGVKGERTGARGHDLSDGSEVKSCSRVDQLDKCKNCNAAVARIEEKCPKCASSDIKRNNDSKWLLGVKNEEELRFLIEEVPRVVFIISDYPNYDENDWETLRFQVFEIWPKYANHTNFKTLMMNYYYNIYLHHVQQNPNKTPAPKNFWPYSFQFYMCNPIRTFHCIVRDALENPIFDKLEYVEPIADRTTIAPAFMPMSVLYEREKDALRAKMSERDYTIVENQGLNAKQRMLLDLRETDRANPHIRLYRRGDR